MHRKLLPAVLWLCAICFCSIITGMGVVLLTGGRAFPPPFTPAPITRTLSPDLVLQSTAEAAPVSPSIIPKATLDLSGVLAAQPFASNTLSPSPLVTTTITSSAPPAPSPPSSSPSAVTAPTSTPAPTGTSAALSANDIVEPVAEFELPSTPVVHHHGFMVASPDGRAQATFDNLGVERFSSP